MAETERQLSTTSVAGPARVSSRAREEFTEFYSSEFRGVVASVLYLGATLDEAKDATCAAMVDVLKDWDDINNPARYARTAAARYFVKERQRARKLRLRLIEHGAETPDVDPTAPSVWEEHEWVMQLLGSLPPAQREAMALIFDEFTPSEIAEVMGKSAEAVRQTLYAARRRLRQELSSSGTAAESPVKGGRLLKGKEGRQG